MAKGQKKDEDATEQTAGTGERAESVEATEEGANYPDEVVNASNPAAAAMMEESGSAGQSTVRLQPEFGRTRGVAVGDTLYTEGAKIDTEAYGKLVEEYPGYFVPDAEQESEES